LPWHGSGEVATLLESGDVFLGEGIGPITLLGVRGKLLRMLLGQRDERYTRLSVRLQLEIHIPSLLKLVVGG
jgi:hypothetical protein